MKILVVNGKAMSQDHKLIQKISEISLKDENLSYRSTSLITNSFKKGDFLIATNEDSKILGWVEKYKIWNNWWGLSTLYVFPEYRGKKISKKLLISSAAKELVGKNIFAATTNNLIQSMLFDIGFKKVSLNTLPLMVKTRLLLLRYFNLRSLFKLLKLKNKGFAYFLRKNK
ncbi:MAG: GNAT family N-acetyltransferase [Candidatus Woykebacteria bacterium]